MHYIILINLNYFFLRIFTALRINMNPERNQYAIELKKKNVQIISLLQLIFL